MSTNNEDLTWLDDEFRELENHWDDNPKEFLYGYQSASEESHSNNVAVLQELFTKLTKDYPSKVIHDIDELHFLFALRDLTWTAPVKNMKLWEAPWDTISPEFKPEENQFPDDSEFFTNNGSNYWFDSRSAYHRPKKRLHVELEAMNGNFLISPSGDYPTRVCGLSRFLVLTGKAYFQHYNQKPFKVKFANCYEGYCTALHDDFMQVIMKPKSAIDFVFNYDNEFGDTTEIILHVVFNH